MSTKDKESTFGWEVLPLDEIVSRGDPKLAKTFTGGKVESAEMECPSCHIEMTKSWNEFNLVCPKCHVSIKIGVGESHTIAAGENHNVSSNAYMSFKPTGTNNRLYLNTMIKYTSEYEPFRDMQILQLLKQYNYINQDFKVPLDVIKAACEMFISLRNLNYVVRGKTRRGVLGACIYEQCRLFNVTKTKTQVAKMMQVEESKITFGLEELQNYDRLGVVKVTQNVDPTSDYVDTFFESFDLDQTKKPFVIDLLARMAQKQVEEVQSCQNVTRVVGAVYFLSRLMGWGLTHDRISAAACGISRGTYLNIANAILKNQVKLRKPFIRHGIPLPSSWTPKKTANDSD